MVTGKFKYFGKRLFESFHRKLVVKAEIKQLSYNKLLENRVAFITGGSSGIGFAIAEAFLKSGAKVILTGRSEEKLKKAIDYLSKFGDCIELKLDLFDIDSFQSVIERAISIYGRIDILVNNAGVSGGLLVNATKDKFDEVIDTNLRGPFFLSKIIGRYMVDNDIHGNILNISSASSVRPAACAYTLSKWGIRGFTQGLARTLLPYNIIVNALAPGPVATPMLSKQNINENISLPRTPSGRYALPCEIANMAVILVSDLSRLIVGETIFMTGGAGTLINTDIDYPF